MKLNNTKRELVAFPLQYLILVFLVSLHKVFKHIGSADTCIKDSNTVNVPLCFVRHILCILLNYIYLLIAVDIYTLELFG